MGPGTAGLSPLQLAFAAPYTGCGEVIVMMWWNGGQWYWAMTMMVVFWGAVVAIIYFAVRRGPGDRPHPSARELLDERFARGEISEDEYASKRATLEGRTPPPHG